MKKMILAALAATGLLLGGCSTDLTEVEERLDNLEKVSIVNLQGQIAQLTSTLNSLEGTQKTLSDYITALQGTVSALEAKVDSGADAAEIASLKNTVAALQSDIKALQTAQASMEGSIAALQESIGTSADDVKKWVENSFATLQQVNALQDALATVNSTLQAVDGRLTALEGRVSGLEASIDELQAFNDNLKLVITDIATALIDLKTGLLALQEDMDAVKEQMAAIVSAVQSVVAVPDYSDGSVKLAAKKDATVRFEIYPLEAAENVLKLGMSALSLDYVETETKSDLLQHIAHTSASFDGEVVTLHFDATALPQDVLSGKQAINARLKISDGTVTRTSPYFSFSVPQMKMVDLGLSVQWGAWNIGASAPQEYGEYYAWGELASKSVYSWANYKWGEKSALTKYNDSALTGSTVDNLLQLKAEDDIAHYMFEEKWRIPTKGEMEELINQCYWTLKTIDHVNGYEVKSKLNGNTIFLPLAGDMLNASLEDFGKTAYYYSSTVKNADANFAWYLWASPNYDSVEMAWSGGRFYGMSIRPVYGDGTPVTGVSLVEKDVEIPVGESVLLRAEIEPATAFESGLIWSSSNVSVATVENGLVSGISVGSATITVETVDGGFTASCDVTVKAPLGQRVDMGLSVEWATFNLGATTPEEYGDYFGWGEIEPKEDYSWSSYYWSAPGEEGGVTTKYNNKAEYGTLDYRSILELADDAAAVQWGSKWRTPTKAEWTELMQKCEWVWEIRDAIKGYKVTSKTTGNSIFLPAAGFMSGSVLNAMTFYGEYWCSLVYSPRTYTGLFAAFNESKVPDGSMSYTDRYYGLSIRPVYGDYINVTGVTINEPEVSLKEGASTWITSALEPKNAFETNRIWTSSDESVATVIQSGTNQAKVTGVAAGTAVITVQTVDGGYTASCTVTVKSAFESVDLGLSVEWASWNIGAENPEDFGGYYAWGEIEPKSEYSWDNYKWCNGSEKTLTKYNFKEEYGAVDNRTVLEPEDDIAHVSWGGAWRMPTEKEYTELITKCTWDWETRGDVQGYKVTGPSGNSIFLPAGGNKTGGSLSDENVCFYWSVSVAGVGWSPNNAWRLLAYKNAVYSERVTQTVTRYRGYTIRAVKGGYTSVTGLSLKEDSKSMNVGDNAWIESKIAPADAFEANRVWTSSNPSVVTVNPVNGGTSCEITAVALGKATVTATTVDGGFTASCAVTVSPATVDLGLSVQWAAFNLGASAKEEIGNYYAWGETEPKDMYSWSTYKWGTSTELTKYNANPSNGPVDYRTYLMPEDDAATAAWGEEWRIPSRDEWNELYNPENCTWAWTSVNEVNGYEVTSKKNGNKIFLPVGGRNFSGTVAEKAKGYYWTARTVFPGATYNANVIQFDADNIPTSFPFQSRATGLPVRAVKGAYKHVTGLSLPETKEMTEGATISMDASITPNDAFERVLSWKSSDESIVSVAAGTNTLYAAVTAVAPGTATVTVTTADGGLTASCTVTVKGVFKAVDLGLSVKWANWNIGASAPEEYGDYFAWGEVETKKDFSWPTYKWCLGSSTTITKYNTQSHRGTVDNKLVLDLEDDVAHVKLGDGWRIPTKEEFMELGSQCKWTWDTYCGVKGYIVTGPNGNSIFLPAAGHRDGENGGIYGYYWTSNLPEDGSTRAEFMYFGSSSHSVSPTGNREDGLSVRAVRP